jgi:L-2,4-diaminobutyrate decarboxylase
MLLCPALTTAVIFKNNDHSYETFSQKASYLLSNQKKENWYDIAQRTLECTKKMMGVKVYAVLKAYGSQLFAEYITRTYDLAKEFAALVKESKDFRLAIEPGANIVCFRYAPRQKDGRESDELNRDIRNRLKEAGEFYIVQTDIDDRVFLRVSLMNPFTTKNDIIGLLQAIREKSVAPEQSNPVSPR